MKLLSRALVLVLSGSLATTAANVRENGENCEGVKSCRPRCITFAVERDISSCGLMDGVFTVQEDVNPWDTKRFSTANCAPLGTCENGFCGMEFVGDLTVRVGEAGHHGSYYYTTYALQDGGDDRFTHCSMYPCTKEECAVPEQMGLELQFSFFTGAVRVDDFAAVPLLVQEFYLKAAFVGAPLLNGKDNRFGPMHMEWMDDPVGCRVGHLSVFAPVAPPLDPVIWTNNTKLQDSLYCEGEEYLPLPLPVVAPTLEPSSVPTVSPSMSVSPSSAPSHTAIGVEQMEGLRALYDATEMSAAISKEVHNWFKSKDYCRYTGVTCDERGYVIMLDVTDRRLAGTIPASLEKLGRLRQLKLVNNRIKGTIPEKLCNMQQLTQLELGTNQLTGSIPPCLNRLRHLRRLLLQFNDLSGTIPSEFCQFGQLNSFDIAGNRDMHGEIPPCMGSLPLDFLRVDNVGLVGTVPPRLCNRKSMNGLNPNPYGCNAIACPAGTFEPTVGRSYRPGSQCIPCDVPSNIIGSTICRYVLNNTVISVTDPPSSLPTSSPSLSPLTESPTFLPTFLSPTMSDYPSMTLDYPISGGSTEPSLPPSFLPTLPSSTVIPSAPSFRPSAAPSSNPSLGSVVLNITAVFYNVQSMLESGDLQTLARETMGYLLSSNVAVERVTILNQSIGNSTSGGAQLASKSSRWRRLVNSLVVDFGIEGRVSDASSFEAQVQSALVDNFSSYSSYLLEALPALVPVTSAPTSSPTRAPTQIKEQNEFIVRSEDGSSVNWWLLGSAIALSVVAILAVLFVRHARRARRNRTRLFPVEQTAITGSAGLPSVQLNDGLGDVLSDESSSGWNSTSSPGEFGNDEDYVNDEVVREWTSSASTMDADSYLTSPMRRNVTEEELI